MKEFIHNTISQLLKLDVPSRTLPWPEEQVCTAVPWRPEPCETKKNGSNCYQISDGTTTEDCSLRSLIGVRIHIPKAFFGGHYSLFIVRKGQEDGWTYF